MVAAHTINKKHIASLDKCTGRGRGCTEACFACFLQMGAILGFRAQSQNVSHIDIDDRCDRLLNHYNQCCDW